MLSGSIAHAAAVARSLLLLLLLSGATIAAAQSTPPGAKPQRRDAAQADDEFAAWLVRMQYCHRLAVDPESARRIADLQGRRDAAATPAERRTIEREIKKLESESDDKRPHAIYGWSVQTDDTGKPVDSTRSMTGFILAATADNNKAIAAVRQAHEQGKPAIIALDRKGSADLFTFAGRHWYRVDRAAALAKPATIPEPGVFHIPPDAAMTEEQRRAVTVSLRHERSEEGKNGSTLHRYWIQIQGDRPPANASRLRVWIAASIEIDGERIGPIIDDIEVSKSSSGAFRQSQSFEFIARAGAKLKADATTAEPLAIAWE